MSMWLDCPINNFQYLVKFEIISDQSGGMVDCHLLVKKMKMWAACSINIALAVQNL